jgi:hypothetical protein
MSPQRAAPARTCDDIPKPNDLNPVSIVMPARHAAGISLRVVLHVEIRKQSSMKISKSIDYCIIAKDSYKMSRYVPPHGDAKLWASFGLIIAS